MKSLLSRLGFGSAVAEPTQLVHESGPDINGAQLSVAYFSGQAAVISTNSSASVRTGYFLDCWISPASVIAAVRSWPPRSPVFGLPEPNCFLIPS